MTKFIKTNLPEIILIGVLTFIGWSLFHSWELENTAKRDCLNVGGTYYNSGKYSLCVKPDGLYWDR